MEGPDSKPLRRTAAISYKVNLLGPIIERLCGGGLEKTKPICFRNDLCGIVGRNKFWSRGDICRGTGTCSK
jgi:hypothetical protein